MRVMVVWCPDWSVVAALEDGVRTGTVDLDSAGDLDIRTPRRRRISSAV